MRGAARSGTSGLMGTPRDGAWEETSARMRIEATGDQRQGVGGRLRRIPGKREGGVWLSAIIPDELEGSAQCPPSGFVGVGMWSIHNTSIRHKHASWILRSVSALRHRCRATRAELWQLRGVCRFACQANAMRTHIDGGASCTRS